MGGFWRRNLARSSGLTSRSQGPPKTVQETGPVTILEWSYVRDDIPKKDVALQIALAVRDETRDLENIVKLKIIQIDEAAFREGLPLRKSEREDISLQL